MRSARSCAGRSYGLQSALEKAESLEQLRWLENGYKIGVGVTDAETINIDARRSGEGRSLPDQAWKMKSRESKPGCLAGGGFTAFVLNS